MSNQSRSCAWGRGRQSQIHPEAHIFEAGISTGRKHNQNINE